MSLLDNNIFASLYSFHMTDVVALPTFYKVDFDFEEQVLLIFSTDRKRQKLYQNFVYGVR